MAKKRNDFLSRIQAQQAREMEHAAAVGAAYLQAAIFDAAMLTLGYDEMMGKNPWGGEKLSRFTFALYEWFRFVWYGVGFEPDADARRAEVDKLLRKKLPAKYFVPWRSGINTGPRRAWTRRRRGSGRSTGRRRSWTRWRPISAA